MLERAGDAVEVVSHLDHPLQQQQQQQQQAQQQAQGDNGSGGGASAAATCIGPAFFEALRAERTRHGWVLLPDATGWGPIYLCVLHKSASLGSLRRQKANKYSRQG